MERRRNKLRQSSLQQTQQPLTTGINFEKRSSSIEEQCCNSRAVVWKWWRPSAIKTKPSEDLQLLLCVNERRAIKSTVCWLSKGFKRNLLSSLSRAISKGHKTIEQQQVQTEFLLRCRQMMLFNQQRRRLYCRQWLMKKRDTVREGNSKPSNNIITRLTTYPWKNGAWRWSCGGSQHRACRWCEQQRTV